MASKNFSPVYPKENGGDYRQVLIDYVVTALEQVIRDPGKYLPDSFYTMTPGEITIHLPLNGAAYVESSTETYITK